MTSLRIYRKAEVRKVGSRGPLNHTKPGTIVNPNVIFDGKIIK